MKKTCIIIRAVLCILLGLVTFCFAPKFSSYDFHKDQIEYIDTKRDEVISISATSAVISTAISALPDDTATPIATKIMDISSYSLLVVAVLYTEKYLLTVLPWIALRWLIPIACGCHFVECIFAWFKRQTIFEKLSYTVALIGILLTLIMPFSIGISQKIQATYDDEITTSINNVTELTENLYQYDEDASWWDKLVGTVSDTATLASEVVNTAIEGLTEAMGILIVTCFVIPVLTAFALLGLLKMSISLVFKTSGFDGGYALESSLDRASGFMADNTKKLLSKPRDE